MVGKYLICIAVVLQHRNLGPDAERHQGSIPGLALIIDFEGLPPCVLLRACVPVNARSLSFVALALPSLEGLALCPGFTDA